MIGGGAGGVDCGVDMSVGLNVVIGGGVGCEGCGGDGGRVPGKPYFTKNKKIPWLFLYEDRIFTEKNSERTMNSKNFQ